MCVNVPAHCRVAIILRAQLSIHKFFLCNVNYIFEKVSEYDNNSFQHLVVILDHCITLVIRF